MYGISIPHNLQYCKLMCMLHQGQKQNESWFILRDNNVKKDPARILYLQFMRETLLLKEGFI